MVSNRAQLGRDGEAAAAQWYERRGYEVLARNWRCRDGELDLVVANTESIVFCEVKTRSTTAFGSAAEAVDWRKQRRIRRLAAIWLSDAARKRGSTVRFDVAAVAPVAGVFVVEVIEEAF